MDLTMRRAKRFGDAHRAAHQSEGPSRLRDLVSALRGCVVTSEESSVLEDADLALAIMDEIQPYAQQITDDNIILMVGDFLSYYETFDMIAGCEAGDATVAAAKTKATGMKNYVYSKLGAVAVREPSEIL